MSANTFVSNPEHFGVPTVGIEAAKTIISEEQMTADHERELLFEQKVGRVVVGGGTGVLGGSITTLIWKGIEAMSSIEHPIPDKYLIPSVILGSTLYGAARHVNRRRQTAEEVSNLN